MPVYTVDSLRGFIAIHNTIVIAVGSVEGETVPIIDAKSLNNQTTAINGWQAHIL